MNREEEVKKIIKFEFSLISPMVEKELDFNAGKVAEEICQLFEPKPDKVAHTLNEKIGIHILEIINRREYVGSATIKELKSYGQFLKDKKGKE